MADDYALQNITTWRLRELLQHEHELQHEQQDNRALRVLTADLLGCLRRMCGIYGAYSKRLAPLLAEDEGTIWTFERANSLALEAIAKAECR
jgi:hypothetical protein